MTIKDTLTTKNDAPINKITIISNMTQYACAQLQPFLILWWLTEHVSVMPVAGESGVVAPVAVHSELLNCCNYC